MKFTNLNNKRKKREKKTGVNAKTSKNKNKNLLTSPLNVIENQLEIFL